MTADVLVVMARQPIPGTVKTRLAQSIGADAAAALYRAFLIDIAAGCASPAWSLVWAVTPIDADLTPIVGGAARQIVQRGDGLGERMQHAFADLFAAGARRVVMIGADAPHLGAACIAEAFAALATHDVVLAPTQDGGYCLIGLTAPRELFRGVAMGTDSVRAETLARAAALGLRVAQQAQTFDIDLPADLETLAVLLDRAALRLPATAAALASMRRGGAPPGA
ncbi:MAG: TIGR04282 family arsenosugar biosynthesis glycosyltransferase [Deltaproteobacteria bacterium]|nr:TIGR04282 family arsenosugar biosynthesis glycosyltransferase [Deltaproteobacteria bacterium]